MVIDMATEPDFEKIVLEWALYYWDQGFSIIPVPQETKAPRIPWARYQVERPSREQIAEWWSTTHRGHNIALICGAVSNVWAVDVDVDEVADKDGNVALAALEAEHGPLPDTWQQFTGRGGRHILFRYPFVHEIKTGANTIAKSVDSRGAGGYIIVAPSVHPNRRSYHWDVDHFPGQVPIAPAPSWLEKLVLNGFQPGMDPLSPLAQVAEIKSEPATITTSATVVPFPEPSQGLGLAPLIADGREGYMFELLTANLVEQIYRHGRPPTVDQLFDATWPVYAHKVDLRRPGRGPTEFRAKCVTRLDAFSRGQIPGARTVDEAIQTYAAKVANQAPAPHAANHPHGEFGELVVKITDWPVARFAGPAPEQKWLLKGLIPLGVPGLLAGQGGLGKSFLMLDVGLRIAGSHKLGDRIMGAEISERGSVVILTAEDNEAAIHRRLEKIDPAGTRRQDARGLYVIPLANAGGALRLVQGEKGKVAKSPAFTVLLDQLSKIPNLRLVVIDPLQSFISANINDDPAAGAFMWTAFNEICSRTGATLLATHHMRKNGNGPVATLDAARDAIRGSSALVDGCRFALGFWPISDDQARPICEQLGIEHAPNRVVAGGVVKSNDDTDNVVRYFVRDSNGLLVEHSGDVRAAEASANAGPSVAVCQEILDEIQAAFDADLNGEGDSFTDAPQGGPRYAVRLICRRAKINREAARNLLYAWIDNGVVELKLVSSKTKKHGLTVKKRLAS